MLHVKGSAIDGLDRPGQCSASSVSGICSLIVLYTGRKRAKEERGVSAFFRSSLVSKMEDQSEADCLRNSVSDHGTSVSRYDRTPLWHHKRNELGRALRKCYYISRTQRGKRSRGYTFLHSSCHAIPMKMVFSKSVLHKIPTNQAAFLTLS